jgi:hypothetical protein
MLVGLSTPDTAITSVCWVGVVHSDAHRKCGLIKRGLIKRGYKKNAPQQLSGCASPNFKEVCNAVEYATQ